GGHDRLVLVHRLDVAVRHEALGEKDRPDLLDGVVQIRGPRTDADALAGQDIADHPPPAWSEIDWPAWSRFTRRSLAGLLRKFRNDSTTACGAALRARAARPSWAITTSVLGGIWLTGEWMTWTARPASFTRFFSWFAPIRLEPIPASQANAT